MKIGKPIVGTATLIFNSLLIENKWIEEESLDLGFLLSTNLK